MLTFKLCRHHDDSGYKKETLAGRKSLARERNVVLVAGTGIDETRRIIDIIRTCIRQGQQGRFTSERRLAATTRPVCSGLQLTGCRNPLSPTALPPISLTFCRNSTRH